ncbi:MAG: response regulator [Dehalococcoidia bacterium]
MPDDQPTLPILLIEDNPDIARVLKTIMRFEGYEVTHERDGINGLEQARKPGWCAIILDLGLPRLSGWEILEALRADKNSDGPPVIVVSATAEAMRREEALARGAVEYLVKPVTADVVARTIRQHARQGRRE